MNLEIIVLLLFETVAQNRQNCQILDLYKNKYDQLRNDSLFVSDLDVEQQLARFFSVWQYVRYELPTEAVYSNR